MKITVEFDSLAEFERFFRSTRTTEGKTPLERSGLDQRTVRCLLAEYIEFVEDAQAMDDIELLRIPSLGRKSIAAIRGWKSP